MRYEIRLISKATNFDGVVFTTSFKEIAEPTLKQAAKSNTHLRIPKHAEEHGIFILMDTARNTVEGFAYPDNLNSQVNKEDLKAYAIGRATEPKKEEIGFFREVDLLTGKTNSEIAKELTALRNAPIESTEPQQESTKFDQFIDNLEEQIKATGIPQSNIIIGGIKH